MTEDAPVEIVDGNTVWRFDTEFLTSNWTCLFGRGCKGILDHDATELGQGCCSLGAHFGDGPAGEAEAMTVSAYASMLDPERFQYHHVATADTVDDRRRAPTGSSGTPHGSHTRVVDGAVHLPQPARLRRRRGVRAASRGARCGRLPHRVEAVGLLAAPAPSRLAGDRRHGRIGDRTPMGATRLGRPRPHHGVVLHRARATAARPTPATERVVDSLRDELIALAGEPVYVELRRRLT